MPSPIPIELVRAIRNRSLVDLKFIAVRLGILKKNIVKNYNEDPDPIVRAKSPIHPDFRNLLDRKDDRSPYKKMIRGDYSGVFRYCRKLGDISSRIEKYYDYIHESLDKYDGEDQSAIIQRISPIEDNIETIKEDDEYHELAQSFFSETYCDKDVACNSSTEDFDIYVNDVVDMMHGMYNVYWRCQYILERGSDNPPEYSAYNSDNIIIDEVPE